MHVEEEINARVGGCQLSLEGSEEQVFLPSLLRVKVLMRDEGKSKWYLK